MRPLAVFVFAATVAAQNVCVTGELQPVPGPTICNPGPTHMLAGTDVMLISANVNLQAHVGAVVTVLGTDVGLICRVIDVAQVVDPAPVLTLSCGSPSPGCPVRIATQGPGLGFGMLAIGVGRAFSPLGCGNGAGEPNGTVLLGAAELLVFGQTGSGRVDTVLMVPAANALIGVTVGFQGAHMTLGRQGPLRLSNAVEMTIAPFLPPCAPLNC